MDYFIRNKNRIEKSRNATCLTLYSQGQANDLRFDDWVYILNSKLRPAATSFAITKDGDVKEIIKQVAKNFEESGLFEILLAEGENSNKWVYLSALAFSYF